MLTNDYSIGCLQNGLSRPKTIQGNWKMRVRRRTFRLTQKDLAALADVGIGDIQAMEQFTYIGGELPVVNTKLQRVAHALETDFDALFPDEYLKDLEDRKLSRGHAPYGWMRETSLDELPEPEMESALADDTFERVNVQMDQAALSEILNDLLSEFSPRERLVIEKRFGLDGGDAQTFEEVGCRLGVSRERIRQIEMRVLSRLRYPARSRRLKGYL